MSGRIYRDLSYQQITSINPPYKGHVGAGSPEFILPTNNLNKPAPTQRLNEMN